MCKLRIGNMLRGRSLKRNMTYITRFKITGGGAVRVVRFEPTPF